MKKQFIFCLLFILFVCFGNAKEETIFFEDFNDGNIDENPQWEINYGGNYRIHEGKLISDGTNVGGRIIFSLFSSIPITVTDNFCLSYKGALKQNGTTTPGIGIQTILQTDKGDYYLNIQDGETHSFPLNKHGISVYYSDAIDIYDFMRTNYTPNKDKEYFVKFCKNKDQAFFEVDNQLIDTQNLPNNNLSIYRILLGLHKSITIDDINITIETENTSEVPSSTDPDLIKFAPVLYLHPNEAYGPKEIESMTENADLKEKPDVLLKEAPTSILDVSDLDNSNNMFFDLTNVDMNSDFPMPPVEDFESYKTKIYGTVTTDQNNYKHLQYFIFYPFQNWYTMRHEGDWELVQVTINPGNQIESVQYFFEYFTMAYYNTDLISILEGTHPIVLVGLGSHNNYADIEPIKFEGEYDFVSNLLGRFKSLDKVSSSGKVFKPEGMNVSEDNEETYTIEQIYPSSPLVAFKGRWGQVVDTSLSNSPKGPRYSPKFSQNWRDPTIMSYGPQLPFIAVFLYSPLNIKLESEGNPIDWGSEDILFYNGKDAEPEAAMATGHKNFTVNLEAEDEGNFTLVVFYYDNETNQGIMVKYTGIKNYATTKAKVDASQNSFFILYVDENGDEEYETRYLPDEIIKYNDFAYKTPDEDGDGINDLIDNCPMHPNPGQEDIDNDTIGDVCDECNDPDKDLICDPNDNCQYTYNPNQEDLDKDNIGDLCDTCIDIDKDNICDPADNCPEAYNPNQEDTDKDSIGDACDICNDIDKDGVCSPLDNCEEIYNPDQKDTDKDGKGDSCDLCTDTDNDTICDPVDNCVGIYNPDQKDFNADKKGDKCDSPKYYKTSALLFFKNNLTEKEKIKYTLAQKSLTECMKGEYWKNDFEIKNQNVFLFELVAVVYSPTEVKKMMMTADKEIVQYAILKADNTTRKYKLSLKEYEEGNEESRHGDYWRAIYDYMGAWLLLR